MKKIRIDYYHFRLKKGRADVLLQREAGREEYCIPYHYVKKEECIVRSIQKIPVEDDGDLVLLDIAMNDGSLDLTSRKWFPIKNLLDLAVSRNESFHVWHNILRLFLSLCPVEGESGILKRVREMLEEVRIREAKSKYRKWLQGLVQAQQADPVLVRREMETLEHFHVRRPNKNPLCQLDGELLDKDEYTFYPVDPDVFVEK